eukprot:g6444.t1
MLHSGSSCSCGSAGGRCAGLGSHYLTRRRRRRPREQLAESEHLPAGSGSGGGVARGSSRRNRRREGPGLAISVVLIASSTAAATAVVPPGLELPPSTMAAKVAARSASLHDAHPHRTGLNRTAFVSSATAAGIEPVHRWAVAGCRRLAGATHRNAAAAAAAVTAGLTRRTAGFLRGGLRGGSAGAAGASGGDGLRMISGGVSGEFMPPDESWKRRRAPEKQQQQEEASASPLSSQSNPKFSAREGQQQQEDEEEEEVFSWTPKQNGGQGSWDSRNALVGGAADKDHGPIWRVNLKRGVYTGDVKIKQPLGLDLVECSDGVCISKVHKGCSAERLGVRAGDRVVATSATLGDVLWEKNTVDGILSAVGTRLVFSNTVTLRVERALDAQQLAAARFRESVTQTYEVTLRRPPGLILEQVWDSSGKAESVVVAGILPGSPAEASGAVECGDTVVAVSSSLGNVMWPYRQLEGALSAIERHIGNTINIRFQRTVQMGAWTDPTSTDTDRTIDSTLKVFRQNDVAATASAGAGPLAAAAAAAKNAGFDVDGGAVAGGGVAVGAMRAQQDDEARTIVLERCGALVRSYGAKKQAIAVDNLLASMEKAGVQMNARFLNNALMAYLSCSAPQKAVDTFHAVTGIVWPDLPPWSDTANPVVKRKPSTPAISTHDADSDIHESASPRTAAPSAHAPKDDAGPQFPAEFQLLQDGPSRDDALVLEASSWEGTRGQRFLQMRAVAEQVAEQMSNRAGRAAAAGVGVGADADADAGAAAAPAATSEGPLKMPALGEYVGGCRPNAMLVATVVKAHGRRRRLDDACRLVLRMADWGLKPDVAVFNSLAAAAVWNGRMDLALQVVLGGVMQAWGVQPNQLSYNTIMDAYARQGNVRNVVKIYNFMQGEGIPPDVVTTTILVKAQVASGDVEAGAQTLIEMMKSSNLKDQLDAFPFNTIIKGLMKTLQWEKALDLFRGMMYNNVKPNVMTFNTLMAGLNKARVPSITVGLYEEMMQVGGLLPDVYTYSSLVSAYARLGDVEAAVKVLSDMAKSGVKPNRFTLSSVMQACIKAGQPGTALEVFGQLTKNGGVEEDEVISTLLVQARAMVGKFDEAFQAVTAMGNSGHDNKVCFNHLIRECVLAGEWDRASEAITRMVQQGKGGRGVRFDHNTFNAVSEVPRGYDGTEAAAWPRLTFLMKTKDIVLEKKWEYSSTLYLAILVECMGRQDFAMANMVVEERKAGRVYVHPADRHRVEEVEEKIGFKMRLRPTETVWIS